MTLVANISATPAHGVPPRPVAFDASASFSDAGDIVSYRWNFGDESTIVTSASPTQVHTYVAVGSYTVVLTVIDEDDIESSTSFKINMTSAPAPAVVAPSLAIGTEVWYDYVAFAAQHSITLDESISVLREATFILSELTEDQMHGRRWWRAEYRAPVSGRIDLHRGPVEEVTSVRKMHSCDSDSFENITNYCLESSHTLDLKSRSLSRLGTPYHLIGGGYNDLMFGAMRSGGCGCNDTYVIEYVQASTLVPGSDRVVKKLAEEYLKALTGAPCALPERITTVSRQGMSWTLLDPQDFLENGLTGISQIDHWLSAVRRRTNGLKLRDPLNGVLLRETPIGENGMPITDPPGDVGSDLSAVFYPIVRTSGDTMEPEEFKLTRAGEPWLIDTAVAQVRADRSTSSTLLLDMSISIVGDTVTVGADDLLDFGPGTFYWDLQVTDNGDDLTVLWGTFVLEPETSV